MDHSKHPTHKGGHPHEHGPGCGHTAIEHGDHVDFVHDGHLHHKHGDDVHDCKIGVSDQNPDDCTGGNGCDAHDGEEICGPGCGHEAVPHGDHTDYLVPDGNGQFDLHCPHDDHCDHHGKVPQAKLQP